ncbi:DUF4880 domain-containing protein [Pseudomonas sp. R5(2019)]|uniref:DUF4880 domain-containing protein n=1 Tax=Pseudomonas sp. R5(2019) TaxID=2697566 RepID=UPI0014125BD7|nr:DUF4880 domain-containing protein [Pseudomonas sp. R5(2019)]NBA95031.1 DUF4880 domain-containing protein [Pseudomonas sp. R5(2019)]
MSSPEFSPQVAEQAVHWLIEMQGGGFSPRQQQEWQRWLEAHSEHQRAWEHIQRVNQRLRGVSSPLAHAALGAPRSPGRRRALKALLLLGVGSATGLALQRNHTLVPLLADYRSPVGEQRRLALEDGSRLHLNTASSVDVRFDGQQRLIHLLEGELLVHSAVDSRPLRILTAQGLLQPQAGRVSVRQMPEHTRVAAFDSTVSLAPRAFQGQSMRLLAGQQTRFSDSAQGPVQALDKNSAAWVDGMLVAAHIRLGDFLAELARYRRGQLNCAPQVADLLISGSYPLADSERILDVLEVALPVRVRRFTRYWVTVQARA